MSKSGNNNITIHRKSPQQSTPSRKETSSGRGSLRKSKKSPRSTHPSISGAIDAANEKDERFRGSQTDEENQEKMKDHQSRFKAKRRSGLKSIDGSESSSRNLSRTNSSLTQEYALDIDKFTLSLARTHLENIHDDDDENEEDCEDVDDERYRGRGKHQEDCIVCEDGEDDSQAEDDDDDEDEEDDDYEEDLRSSNSKSSHNVNRQPSFGNVNQFNKDDLISSLAVKLGGAEARIQRLQQDVAKFRRKAKKSKPPRASKKGSRESFKRDLSTTIEEDVAESNMMTPRSSLRSWLLNASSGMSMSTGDLDHHYHHDDVQYLHSSTDNIEKKLSLTKSNDTLGVWPFANNGPFSVPSHMSTHLSTSSGSHSLNSSNSAVTSPPSATKDEHSMSAEDFHILSSKALDEINVKDANGNTPLHWAVTFNQVDHVLVLIENGADLNALDKQGNSPLLLAFQHNHKDLIDIFLDQEADIHVKDKNGNTPLHLALSHNFSDIASLLIHMGADINSQNNNGNSPLLLAVHMKNLEVAKSLVNTGAEVNSRNRYSDTPLLHACTQGDLELVLLLLSKGADTEARDKTGSTPLIVAAARGQKDIVEALIEYGANLRAKNDNNMTALEVSTTPQIRKLCEDYDPSSKSWKWEIEYNELKIDYNFSLGSGNSADCYRGYLHGTPVAVKHLKVALTENALQSFHHEVGLMCDIKNPYCLLFIGACIRKPHFCIITEYLPNKSLRDFLNRNTINWNQLLRFAISTARGMAWLHSRKPPILHRDMHSNNILVTDSLECKVADFGLSQIQGKIYQTHKLYKRIIPPEILRGETYTKQSDVFMYGLILYELLTNSKADLKTAKNIQFLEDESFFRDVKGRDLYFNLLRNCCASASEERPSFEDIIEILQILIDKHNQNVREEHIVVSNTMSGEYTD